MIPVVVSGDYVSGEHAGTGAAAAQLAAVPAHASPAAAAVGAAEPAPILIVGCSGHARVIIDILERDARYHIIGLADSYKPVGTELLGYRIFGPEEDIPALFRSGVCVGGIVAIGDNWARAQVVDHIRRQAPDFPFVTAIHPSAQIAPDVQIGAGTAVMAGAIVNTGSQVGDFCILNTGCSLDHDSILGDFASLAPRAVTGGKVTIGTFSAIGIGATVSHAIRIGEHTIIGAGSTVVRDIPSRVVAYGTPARVVRSRNAGDAYLASFGVGAADKRPAVPPAVHSCPRGPLHLMDPASPEWSGHLERCPHDFFHTAAYHSLVEQLGQGQPKLAIYGGRDKFVAWPYVLQDMPDERTRSPLTDVTSAYGYAGPLLFRCADDAGFLTAAADALLDLWRSQHAVSIFTRFHPILMTSEAVGILAAAYTATQQANAVALHGRTVVIDVSESKESIWQGYKPKLRQSIHRCQRESFKTSHDEQWQCLDDFIDLYYRTMKRNNATPYYFFHKKYFTSLQSLLGPHGRLVVTSWKNETAAIALVMEYGGLVTVHLLASDDRFCSWAPSKLLVHDVAVWAQERGNHYVQLGGGRANRDDDSLFTFKALFSRVFFPFYTMRIILSPGEYEQLSQTRTREAARRGRQLIPDFFPAYRAPFRPEMRSAEQRWNLFLKSV